VPGCRTACWVAGEGSRRHANRARTAPLPRGRITAWGEWAHGVPREKRHAWQMVLRWHTATRSVAKYGRCIRYVAAAQGPSINYGTGATKTFRARCAEVAISGSSDFEGTAWLAPAVSSSGLAPTRDKDRRHHRYFASRRLTGDSHPLSARCLIHHSGKPAVDRFSGHAPTGRLQNCQ
jgi:hypothetical protein